MKLKNELSSTGIQTYLYLIKTGKPVGPREVMRGAKLTSPSVAYRNLQKLIDLNLVEKDNYGNYLVKKIELIKAEKLTDYASFFSLEKDEFDSKLAGIKTRLDDMLKNP